MAKVIYADNKIEDVKLAEGERFTQCEIASLVGGRSIERLEAGSKVIFTDGMSRLKSLRFNLKATIAAESCYIFGTAVICDKNEEPL